MPKGTGRPWRPVSGATREPKGIRKHVAGKLIGSGSLKATDNGPAQGHYSLAGPRLAQDLVGLGPAADLVQRAGVAAERSRMRAVSSGGPGPGWAGEERVGTLPAAC